ncbi:MAG: 5-histidylcysteine sulfoxide synthase [bacterium]|nr:5-histidylcysteine sulfoxide synthase [bacterium]
MTMEIMSSPRLDQGTPEVLRGNILAYFKNSWDVYEDLFEVMSSDESYFTRADPLRHPIIFYLGHTATFFINKMVLAKVISKRVDSRFESIFAIGVDEMSWDDLNECNYEWPTVAEVWEYRKKVRAVVEKCIEQLELNVPVKWEDPFWVIMMGIEHERIHLETSSVLMRQLPLDQVKENENWPVCPDSGEAPTNSMEEVKAGTIIEGQPVHHPYFAWDNEFGVNKTDVKDFKASKFLVSNEEFYEFIKADGYKTEKFWTEEGWAWRNYTQAEQPTFWVKTATGDLNLRCMTKEIPIPWDWPAEVNYLEAKAFCNWKSEATGKPIRLPTEAEWHAMLQGSSLADQKNWEGNNANINLKSYASSCPVNKNGQGNLFDVVGNVWQWTETPISGFSGFRVHPLYDDFSTPTFDSKHNIFKGGSWISTGNEASPFSRYAFRRHFFQHAGFRYVETETEVDIRIDVYETDDLVSQYCEFHFGEEYYKVPNFPKATADLCINLMKGRSAKRALDLGCATGRSTFELAKCFDKVTGIDFSARFIRVGHEIQQTGKIRYALPHEGELLTYHERFLSDFDLDETVEKVEFWQGDAHNLKEQFSNFDLVMASNLIDRLYNPARFLTHITERINPGGLLVLFSPYTWLEEFTPKENWLGGIKIDGENVTTLEGLSAALKVDFNSVGEPLEVPFVIRETGRKFQHTMSQMTVWEKKH